MRREVLFMLCWENWGRGTRNSSKRKKGKVCYFRTAGKLQYINIVAENYLY